jgi:hypothetical protein
MSEPLTAIMLTQTGRAGLVRRAAENFLAQKYEGDSELQIYPDNKAALEEVTQALTGLKNAQRVGLNVPTGESTTLSWLLGQAVTAAKRRGGLLAIWDDDNQCHPLRLARQADAVKSKRICLLSSAVWHFFDTAELFVADREKRHEDLQGRIVHCSLVARVEDVPDPHPKWAWKGTSPTTLLARVTQSAHDSERCVGEWWWMAVGVRGDNANGYEWHRRYGATERSADARWLTDRRTMIEWRLDDFRWDGPMQLDVCGRDGMAFKFTPRGGWPATFPPVGSPQGIEVVTEQVEETDAPVKP